MGLFEPEYAVGEQVLYRKYDRMFLMKISGAQFHRCEGNILPRWYFDGNTIEVYQTERGILEADMKRESWAINVPTKSLERVVVTELRMQ